MKNLFKSAISFILVFVMLAGIIACEDKNKSDDPEATTSSTTTTEATTTASTTAATTTEEKRDPVELKIFESGKCNFTVYCNTSKRKLKEAALAFAADLKAEHNVTLEVKDFSKMDASSGKSIIFGEGNEASDNLAKKLVGYNDFAISVEENALVVAATNEVSYKYVSDYIVNDLFSNKKAGNLTLTDENSLVYSDSAMYGTTYPEFWRETNGTCAPEAMLEFFENNAFASKDGVLMYYRLYVPSDYDPEKEYPFVLFLHGAGHRGSDNAETVKGIAYNLFNHKNPLIDDMIVLVPQCPSNMQWVDYSWSNGNYSVNSVAESKAMKAVIELMDKVEAEFTIDDSRRYVFGLSMGGYGTWDIITRYPERFTAAVALCGGGDPIRAKERLKDMPIWAFHAADDSTVSVENTRALVSALESVGGNIRYTEYAASLGYNHGIGTLTARNEDVFAWLFSQVKE